LRVGNDSVIPASSVRDLGIYIDSDASSAKTHVSRMVSSCFGRTATDPQHSPVSRVGLSHYATYAAA